MSMLDSPILCVYSIPLVVAWILYGWTRVLRLARSRRALRKSTEAGLNEPPALHPHFNENLCLGCASCADACPEGLVIGIIDGKARLVSPADCIGHGACAAACPMDAINLVFGTATRGIELPVLSESFETNVSGIFIAGELGGMGLIRNAIEQGRRAIDSIERAVRSGTAADHDVVIVGAGPAGFSATLAAHERRLRYLTIEQEELGGTVAHYPRAKIVLTAPVKMPIYGKVSFRETTKEALLELWRRIETQSGVKIRYGERLESVERVPCGFEVVTTRARYRTRTILLAIGRGGTPRKLDVPGEALPKVVYRLIEPKQYRGRDVLVVGGGDSALEAALSVSAEPDTRVTLSYRNAAFTRAKAKNRDRIEAAQKAGRVTVLLESNVREILPDRVRLATATGELEIANHAIIICAGGVLPTGFLHGLGISTTVKHGSR